MAYSPWHIVRHDGNKPDFPGICIYPLTGDSESSQFCGWDTFKNLTPRNLWVGAVKCFLLSLQGNSFMIWSVLYHKLCRNAILLDPLPLCQICWGSTQTCREGWRSRLTFCKNKTKSLSYLRNVHNRVTAERPSRCQVIGTQHSGDDPILINPPDHGAIHKVNQSKLVHGDA